MEKRIVKNSTSTVEKWAQGKSRWQGCKLNHLGLGGSNILAAPNFAAPVALVRLETLQIGECFQ
jgi:hypothetical protein